MDKLAEGISLVEEVNRLIQDLQESLTHFEKGNGQMALEKLDTVEDSIEDLKEGEFAEEVDIEEELSQALENLEWVSENSDRFQD
ncbi:hypothetical protein K9M06_05370 [Candidatus Bipolaricaulota bacterium]|nr:hypothetical protein [Candidatus Bipolaricaulota bacterium]